MSRFCHDVKILCDLKLLLYLTKGGHNGGQVGYIDILEKYIKILRFKYCALKTSIKNLDI